MQIRLSGKAEKAVQEMMDRSGASVADVVRRALGSHKLLVDERDRGSTLWIEGRRGGRREIIVK